MSLAAGTRLGPYEVLGLIGAGGMGEVYKALDTRLDRTVAIKVLPAGVASDPNRRRLFEQEAKAIAALSHPHICVLHDIGSQDAVDFLVMERLEGETLAARLRRGPLPLNDVLTYGAQMGAALGAAHRRGIVHRDLKPANVMLTPSGVKLLDFGLAKLKPATSDVLASRSTLTTVAPLVTSGALVGTVPYMAPEQLEGKAVDARTDVFALGCVLYEMVTGRRAFEGDSAATVIAAILTQDPASLSSVQPVTPPLLDRLVRTCLAKDPERRWQNAQDVAEQLRTISETGEAGSALPAPTLRRPKRVRLAALSAAVTLAALATLMAFNVAGVRDRVLGPARPQTLTSIAVLPLANLTGRADQQVNVDGLSEMLGSELGTVSALAVKAGPSLKQVDISRSVPDIARQLGVDAVFSGSVQRADERIQVSLRLVQASPERVRWSKNYETPVTEVLNLARLVAQAVAEDLAAPVSAQTQERLATRRAVNQEAWHLVNRARERLWTRDRNSLELIKWLERATALEPTWAVPHADLAFYHLDAVSFGLVYPPGDAYVQARRHAEEAIRLDPGLADGYSSLAMLVWMADFNWDEAEKRFRQAIDRNPSSFPIRNSYGLFLMCASRFDEAFRQYERATELDPLGFGAEWMWVYLYAERYDDALARFRADVAVDARLATDPFLLSFAALAHLAKGDAGGALKACDDSQRAYTETKGIGIVWPLANCGFVFGAAGAPERALAMRRRLEDLERHGQLVDPYLFAQVDLGLGDRDRAFTQLEKAWRERSSNLICLRVDPFMASLRGDPRFQDLLRRINYPKTASTTTQTKPPR